MERIKITLKERGGKSKKIKQTKTKQTKIKQEQSESEGTTSSPHHVSGECAESTAREGESVW